jgi:hypothetical protein
MYAQSERVSKASAPVHAKLNEFLRDLAEVERFLSAATIETTSAEDFSLALARQILLKRAAEKAGLASTTASAEMDSAYSNFRAEYDSYSRAVGFLINGRNEWGALLLAVEADELMRKVEDWVGL